MLNLGSHEHMGLNELDRAGILCVNGTARQDYPAPIMYDVSHQTPPEHLCKQFHCNNSRYLTRSNPNSFIIPRTRGIAEFSFNVIDAKKM